MIAWPPCGVNLIKKDATLKIKASGIFFAGGNASSRQKATSRTVKTRPSQRLRPGEIRGEIPAEKNQKEKPGKKRQGGGHGKTLKPSTRRLTWRKSRLR